VGTFVGTACVWELIRMAQSGRKLQSRCMDAARRRNRRAYHGESEYKHLRGPAVLTGSLCSVVFRTPQFLGQR